MEYKVRIVYKSGYVFEDWFTEFSIQGGTYTWKLAPSSKTFILKLGTSEIESVMQIDERESKIKV